MIIELLLAHTVDALIGVHLEWTKASTNRWTNSVEVVANLVRPTRQLAMLRKKLMHIVGFRHHTGRMCTFEQSLIFMNHLTS